MPPAEPSPLFVAWSDAVRAAARLGPALDLACGRGRHALAAARLGVPCVAMDREREALVALAGAAERARLPVCGVRADLESGLGIPIKPGGFGAIFVFRFLFRPLAGAIAEALAPGGLLLYETFTARQRELPHGPSNPAFLLGEGELPRLFPTLEIHRHWEGLAEGLRPEWIAQLVARRRR